MPLEKPNFEQEREYNPEKLEGLDRLKNFLESSSFELKKEGVPVDYNGRVDINFFNTIYPEGELSQDNKLVDSFKERWYSEVGSGIDYLEMLKTAIFKKFFGAKFIVVRSSYYDDIENGVDNIILERETGNVVCALDNVGDIKGESFEEEKEKVLKRNIVQGGITLKYGFLPGKDNKGFKLGKIESLPVFYLALSKTKIEEGIKKFVPSPQGKSDKERELFEYFLATMTYQTEELLLREVLDLEVRKRIEDFKDSLKNIG